MGMACNPQGRCPTCGYQNRAGEVRCLRCRSVLMLPVHCLGSCAACLAASGAEPVKPKGATEPRPSA